MTSRFLNTFCGPPALRPPFWFMRQAGRYLPEYREIRKTCPDFLSFCYNPEKAVAVTMQPISRFDMDAAVIFSDILVIPDAIGVEVCFVAGEGPKLQAIEDAGTLQKLSSEKLTPVYTIIRQVRELLSPEKAVIGFAGAPWTLACYMIDGEGGGEFPKTRDMAKSDPSRMAGIVAHLEEAITTHLIAQAGAGADVLQLFDSWAGLVPKEARDALVYEPAKRIIAAVKQKFPALPIIGFPRNLMDGYAAYVEKTGVDGLSLGTEVTLAEVAREISPDCVLQGNLDPILLASDAEAALKETTGILRAMQGRRFIFNLGHGILPHTTPAHVQKISEMIRQWQP